ncbi:MAG TPA: response regulator, partial [Kofleriaceae bacterium]|nr:response regulator [Kofleriaceae bacterium]
MIGALQKRFRGRFIETARKRTRAALDGVTLGGSEGSGQAVMELHALAGEAGSLGYNAIVQLALRGEEKARELVRDPAAASACARLLRDIARSISALEREEDAPPSEGRLATQPGAVRTRVLVVDDSVINAEALVEVLEEASLEARSVLGAAAALVEVERFRPDIVLADVHMPGFAPAELCRRLRARAGDRAMRVLFVSALGAEALADVAREAGADGFVPKELGLEAV